MLRALARLLAPRRPAGHRPDGGRFVPGMTPLEAREVPAALPFHETLSLVGVNTTGVASYVGNATHLGEVSATLNPDLTFVKTAANGDTLTGFVAHGASPLVGTVTVTGGTGRFAGATGLSSFVMSPDGATIAVNGILDYGPGAAQATPFKITGSGPAPLGIPLVPGQSGPHSATGNGTGLGRYTSDGGSLTLLSLDPATLTGTFKGSITFVAANGDRLVTNYGSDAAPGVFFATPNADGTMVITFVATFTVDGAASTGRFAGASGSWVMTAVSDPLPLPIPPDGVVIRDGVPYTQPFTYSWSGEGTITLARGKR